jgi:hypothetical protein
MAPSPLQQRRTQNTLLFQKLLNLRDGASPFTLVLDTLEQSGGPIVREFTRRAKVCDALFLLINIFGCSKEYMSVCSLYSGPFMRSPQSQKDFSLGHVMKYLRRRDALIYQDTPKF